MITRDTFKAIYSLYSNVKSIRSDDEGDITAFNEDGSVATIDLTAVEAEVKRLKTNQDNARASALDKLTALGLTVDEVTAILGAK